MKHRLALLAACLTSLAAAAAPPDWAVHDGLDLPTVSATTNQLPNPGFEAGLSQWGWGVTAYTVPAEPPPAWSIDTSQAHSGRSAMRYHVSAGVVPPMVCSRPIPVTTGASAKQVSSRAFPILPYKLKVAVRNKTGQTLNAASNSVKLHRLRYVSS